MSDHELEIVFENVANDSENCRVQNTSETDVICLSHISKASEIPKISLEKAQKIKSDTSEYLKSRIEKIKTKSEDAPKPIQRQIEVDHPKLKLKSVKYASRNEMGKKKLHLYSVKDGINGHFVPSKTLTEEKADSTISESTFKASPVNPEKTFEDEDTLIDSFAKEISDDCPESSSSLATQFSVSPFHLQKNLSKYSDPSLKSPTGGQVNYSKEKLHLFGKPQCLQKNRNFVNSTLPSTDLKEGSKYGTTSPELLQWVQKDSNVSTISSTSELSEVVKVHNSKQEYSETPQCSPNNKIIVNSCSSSTDLSEGSKDSQTSSPELLQWIQNNKSIVHSTSSTSGSSKLVEVHNSKQHDSETPQYSNSNKMLVNSSLSATVTSEGSKDSKTFPELVQKNKSIAHSAPPSTSGWNEFAKVQSGASPLPTQPQIKLSYQLSKRPNKFSINGSPASSPRNRNFYSSLNKSPRSGNRASLSPMNNKFSVNHAPDGRGVKRKLNFSNSSSEVSSTVENCKTTGNNIPTGDEAEPVTSSQVLSQIFGAYHLRQLKLHIDLVLEDSSSRNLINDQEMEIIQQFLDMNSECQDLYARMHNRKHKWNRKSDIKYDTATVENLCILQEKGFLVTDMKNVSLPDMLDLLKVAELKDLCKSLGIKSAQNKKSLSKEMINYCQSQKTLGFQLQVVSSEEVVKQRIENILGTCFILSTEPRGLFRRIHLLFNLKFNRNEQSRGGSQDLFEIQFVGTEKALYPKCSLDKTVKIFTSREDLIKFQTAVDLQTEFSAAVGIKDFKKAEALLSTIRSNFICEFDFISEFDDSPRNSPSNLPLSLRKFTPGTVYAYVLTEGVDMLKKLKKKEKAIDDLLLLLDQTTFLPYMRGRWYEKLMILHRTAGQHKEVAKAICAGMRDPHMDDQGSYVMSCRSRELMRKKFKGVDQEIKLMLNDVPLFPELEYVDRIEIRACALDGKSGYKRVYIQDDETGDGKKFSSVEELVKSHYCPRNFKQGIHAENSLVSSLFGILFWDIIYEYHVPCAFISPYQTRPLDLSTGEFYKNRQAAIDTKLAKISEWTDDDVSSWVTDVYDKNCGKSSVVYWKWFSSSADIVNIINCIGLQVLSKICERYAKKYRGVRSGFPDLCLWSPGEKNKYKFVEVKGPNDTLSTNQKLWLDFLVKINANVEICSVVAQGSKTVKASGTSKQPNSTFEGVDEEMCL